MSAKASSSVRRMIRSSYRSMIVMTGATSTPALAAEAKSAPTLHPNRCVFQDPLALVGTLSAGSSRGRHFAKSTDEAMLPELIPDLHPSTAPPLSSFMDDRSLCHADM